MRYTIDCEFDGHGGPLISLALVRVDGKGFYGTTNHYPADPWVGQNVMPFLDDVPLHKLHSYHGDVNGLGCSLRRYLSDVRHPMIAADSPVDIGRFCQAISTGGRGEWVSTGFPRMDFEVVNVDCWPNKLGPQAIQHNAYWDAMALWEKLNESY